MIRAEGNNETEGNRRKGPPRSTISVFLTWQASVELRTLKLYQYSTPYTAVSDVNNSAVLCIIAII